MRYAYLFFLTFSVSFLYAQVNWQPLPDISGASPYPVAVSNEGHIIIKIFSRGYMRSVDNGKTWMDINEGLPSPDLITKFMVGDDIGNIFMLSSHFPFGPYFRHLYKLPPSGDQWELMDFENGVAIDINDEGTIFIADMDGFWRSDDVGDSFVKIKDWIGTKYRLYSLGDDHNYARLSGPTLYSFKDDGSDFQKVVWQGYEYFNDIERHHSGDFYMSAFGIFRSSNGVTGWERLSLDPIAVDTSFVDELTILPSGQIFAELSNKYIVSDDEGETWQVVENGHPHINGFPYQGNGVLYSTKNFCGDNSFVQSFDEGESWTSVSKNINAADYRKLATDLAGNIYLESCREPYAEWSNNGGANWSLMETPENIASAIIHK